MQTYRVGGAVRDALLGQPVNDHDWVVVGASPEEMVAAGFLPVGKDFPVFLHPQTREEYALARTERKTGPGYHGFSFHAAPDVTLEEDLARRDLTINAMAQDEAGRIHDPFHGQADLQARVLRHVTDAFREDPVRILRLARFAARFTDFHVALETMDLMQAMVAEGEADALVPERVWQELARGLMERQPSRMFEVLRACGALARVAPELDALWERAAVRVSKVLDTSARLEAPLPVRFACLGPELEEATLKALCERLRVPNECRELAQLVAREHGTLEGAPGLGAAGLVHLLERCDAFRKPQRLADALLACECRARADGLPPGAPYAPAQRLQAALAAAQSVATAPIAAQARAAGVTGPGIAEAIQRARVEAVAAGSPPLAGAEPQAGGQP